MHIPDGFIDAKTAVTAAVLSTVGLGYALRQVQKDLPPRRVPLLGLGAAFVFAAQMVNFPVFGGTSGHLVGAALIGAFLGAPSAIIVMAAVLIAQSLLFADGGVTALGANLFNMGVLSPVVGVLVYRAVSRLLPGLRGQVAAMGFAGWCSTVAAAVACAGQLAWSGTLSWSVALPAMGGIHLLIGLGEGAISALVFYAVARSRPSLVGAEDSKLGRSFIAYGLLVTLGVVLFVAPFACPWPDGLETVATRLGFEHAAGAPLASPFADYQIPVLGSGMLSTALAGLLGSAVVFVLAILFSRLVVRAPRNKAPDRLTP